MGGDSGKVIAMGVVSGFVTEAGHCVPCHPCLATCQVWVLEQLPGARLEFSSDWWLTSTIPNTELLYWRVLGEQSPAARDLRGTGCWQLRGMDQCLQGLPAQVQGERRGICSTETPCSVRGLEGCTPALQIAAF